MVFRKLALVGICALMLAACGNDESAKETSSGSTKDTDYTSQNNSINHGIPDAQQSNAESTQDSTKSSKEQTSPDSSTSNKDDQVGFEINSDGKVEEAKSIPNEEKKAIIAAFNENIDAFNAKDINRYAATISEKPKGFNRQEDIDYAKQVFKEYDAKRIAKNITIKKYKQDYAEVFANVKVFMKQDNNSFSQPTNQVSVMVKENGKWVISAIYVMGTKE
ncbi:nuclear transport factor 2 family protein [Rummeliibacillus sp. NPDC094406]|uniref:nuclear transport factor 2 family protein n=1 Tax=Rummeliibacillus sp. NPDC094406 TaxID=3364511 RepID=UPI0037F240C3